MIANTPEPPYYAVILSTVKGENEKEFDKMFERMATLAEEEEGFIGMEAALSDLGILVSYWESPGAIRNWKEKSEHQAAQQKGRSGWFSAFKVRIAKVDRDYGMEQ